jgi:hypothetical protein
MFVSLFYETNLYNNKLYLNKFIMTKEQLEEILTYSQTHAIPEKTACKILMGQDGKTLFYYKKKYGIETNSIGNAPFTARKLRKYQVNDGYFSTLTLENCYYAGFLAADGCITKNQLIVGLSEIDKKWLENFKSSLNAESPIKDRIQKGVYKTCYLNITSDVICSFLQSKSPSTPYRIIEEYSLSSSISKSKSTSSHKFSKKTAVSLLSRLQI